jgi:2,3-bisphosphoglycerate-dependent phosphoglycerate mutase
MGVGVVFETHATSEDNERGVATGWNGGRLSDTGRGQAVELGLRRRDDGVDAVFSSDLHRAVETAEIAFAGSGIPVLVDWRLRECDYGELNGMPRARLEAERRRRLHEPWPGGESWSEAVARVTTFLDDLAAAHDGKRIVVIGHIATRWALEQRVHDRTLEELAETPFRWQPGWEYVL